MRTLCGKLLVAALVLLMASPAIAQRGRGGRGGFGGFGGMAGVGLLMNKSVQDELKLTDAQKEQIKKIQENQQQEMRKAFQPGGDREKARQAFQQVREQTTKSLENVKKGLKPDQARRLHQIDLQVGGLRALAREDVQKDLSLSDKQKDEIKGIADDTQKDAQEIFQSIGQDRAKAQQAMQKVQALNHKATDRALAVLTPEQKAKWKEMIGSKFEIKMERPNFPGGGRRPGAKKRT